MQLPTIHESWRLERNATGLARQFSFESYSQTRRFLDALADLSEREGYYPNLNFNRTQVNVGIEADAKTLGSKEYGFAAQTDTLISDRLVDEGE
ncbi:MAG TPA: hypothetical protein DD979_04360 [Gammaproteobacteria bacterium]|jgi:pterin-4a-carbinolamine dehydratase|nr:hypothetical protein [Gammaproteobacteria bacterium]